MTANRPKFLAIVCAIAASLALSACGASVGSIKTDTDKEFSMEDIRAIHPGMTEAQVVEILGKPASFKVDEENRYLNYAVLKTSSSAAGSATPLVNGMASSNSDTGLAVTVKLKGGIVKNVAYTVYNQAN